jgi:hypothetical protein
MLKYNAQLQKKIEDIFGELNYTIRYEKGNFNSGYCVLEHKKVVVINKFHSLEAKIGALMEIVQQIDVDRSVLSSESNDLLSRIQVEKAADLFTQA